MKSVTFTLETITPLFLGGADGRPELRAPSFKGMMRYWWRAVRGDDNIGKLQDAESKVFGNSDERIGKSKILMKIEAINCIEKQNFLESGLKLRDTHKGLGYLLYSTFMQKGRERGYFDVGSRFKLTISSREDNLNALKVSLASFWVFVYFSGIGTRARRGAGNFAVIHCDDTDLILADNEKLPSFLPNADLNSKDLLCEWLKKNYIQSKSIINDGKSTNVYSTLMGGKLYVLEPSQNYFDALNRLGTQYMIHRTTIKNQIFKGPNFGIPVMHNGFHVRLVGYKDDCLLSERRTSPLIFKVIRVNKLFYPIVVWLNGDLLETGAIIEKEEKDSRNKWKGTGQSKSPDKSEVKNFIDSLKPKAEVIL